VTRKDRLFKNIQRMQQIKVMFMLSYHWQTVIISCYLLLISTIMY